MGMVPSPPLGEQQIDKWTQGVMDIIKLTQDNKITWKRLGDRSASSNVFEANLNGNTFELTTISIFAPTLLGLNHRYIFGQNAKEDMRNNPYLRVKRSGELVTSFPDVAALRGLEQAIETQISARDDDFLHSLHTTVINLGGIGSLAKSE